MEPPFSPMDPARRLHPLTLIQKLLKSLPALFLALTPFLGENSGSYEMIGIIFLALYAAIMVPIILIQYLRFHYWITEREVIIHSGVLTRRKRNIPIERIQNIVLERSLLPRLLGTARVKIETAGSKSAEGILEYVHLAEAERLQAVIQEWAMTSESVSVDTPEPHKRQELFNMPLDRIFLSGAFRFSLIYVVLLFSGMQYLSDVLNLTPEYLADWVLSESVEEYAETAWAHPWLIGGITGIMAVLLGWTTGIVIAVTKYYGFRLWLDSDKLHLRHGLLTVREGTIPLKRVQSLILRTNPFMRLFGWYRLELQTIGYDVEKQGYQVAAPFARLHEILALAPHIRPFTLPTSFECVSPVSIRRTVVRYFMVFAGLLAVPAYFWQDALWGLLLLAPLYGLAVLQYRNHGYALDDDTVYIRRGVFQHYIWVVPSDRFQVFYIHDTFFQRRLGLRSVIIDTAGAGSFRFPYIVDLVAETAEQFAATLYARFQSHFIRGRQVDPDPTAVPGQ